MKVAELTQGNEVAPFAADEWLVVAGLREDPEDAYYRLVRFAGDDRVARLASDLDVEVR